MGLSACGPSGWQKNSVMELFPVWEDPDLISCRPEVLLAHNTEGLYTEEDVLLEYFFRSKFFQEVDPTRPCVRPDSNKIQEKTPTQYYSSPEALRKYMQHQDNNAPVFVYRVSSYVESGQQRAIITGHRVRTDGTLELRDNPAEMYLFSYPKIYRLPSVEKFFDIMLYNLITSLSMAQTDWIREIREYESQDEW